nr:11953_t:CDS:2 [Entrophospora candida]
MPTSSPVFRGSRRYYPPSRNMKLVNKPKKDENCAISSVIYKNQKANITDSQNCITIGHDETCNIRINKPLYIASIHCIISIVKMQFFEDVKIELENQFREPPPVTRKVVMIHPGLQRHNAEIAKMEAKAIPYVVFSNEKVVLSEAKKLITIGCDLKANLRINNPYVASVQCILKIRKTDNMHYVKELDFETVIKNGQNRKTFVNSKQLDWDEELVLNNNDKIYIKVEEDIFDAKTNPYNRFLEEKNHLPAQSGERYHVINNEDGSNNENKIGKSCIVKKVRSNNCSDKNIYAAKIIHVNDGNYDKTRIIEYRNEINILKILDHENIINVIDDYFDEENVVEEVLRTILKH